jgi:hypothetical protein
MNTQLITRITHFLGIILGITGLIFGYADRVSDLSAISPQIAHYWPFILATATLIDRIVKLILTFLSSPPSTATTTTASPTMKTIAILLLAGLTLGLAGCTTTVQPNGTKVTAYDPQATANLVTILDQQAVFATQAVQAAKAMQKTAQPATVQAEAP